MEDERPPDKPNVFNDKNNKNNNFDKKATRSSTRKRQGTMEDARPPTDGSPPPSDEPYNDPDVSSSTKPIPSINSKPAAPRPSRSSIRKRQATMEDSDTPHNDNPSSPNDNPFPPTDNHPPNPPTTNFPRSTRPSRSSTRDRQADWDTNESKFDAIQSRGIECDPPCRKCASPNSQNRAKMGHKCMILLSVSQVCGCCLRSRTTCTQKGWTPEMRGKMCEEHVPRRKAKREAREKAKREAQEKKEREKQDAEALLAMGTQQENETESMSYMPSPVPQTYHNPGMTYAQEPQSAAASFVQPFNYHPAPERGNVHNAYTPYAPWPDHSPYFALDPALASPYDASYQPAPAQQQLAPSTNEEDTGAYDAVYSYEEGRYDGMDQGEYYEQAEEEQDEGEEAYEYPEPPSPDTF